MDYEKKYKETLERAKKMYNEDCETCQSCLEQLFPELAESEDEKIRKAIFKSLSKKDARDILIQCGVNVSEALAWLEKQGEHYNFRQKIQVGDHVTKNEYGELVNLTQLKRVAKPTDKVEPKFKNGQWVVWQDKCYKINYNGCGYELVDQNGLSTSLEYGTIDENAHLWDITKDAKAGDVISFNDGHGNDSIELIKSITDKKIEFWFCLTNSNRYEVFDGIIPYTNLISREDATPATKEQRDLLFQKMKEAGYMWNAEKKELKKIEQKPMEWSEEDEENWSIVIAEFSKCAGKSVSKDEWMRCNDWLNSLRDRVQPQPKQEWSEEDEKAINDIMWIIEAYRKNGFNETHIQIANSSENWLKSLRPQTTWKPSEEQIKAVEEALSLAKNCGEGYSFDLRKLLEKLKEL